MAPGLDIQPKGTETAHAPVTLNGCYFSLLNSPQDVANNTHFYYNPKTHQLSPLNACHSHHNDSAYALLQP